MNRYWLVPYGLAFVLSVAAAPALVPALAQKSTLPPGVAKNTLNPQTIVNQITLAIQEEKKALAGFEAHGSEEALAEARQAAVNAYILLRVARSNLEDVKDRKKFPDPVLDLVFQRVHRAWNNARWPIDAYQPPGSGRARYVQDSIQRMTEAISLMEQVLYMWP